MKLFLLNEQHNIPKLKELFEKSEIRKMQKSYFNKLQTKKLSDSLDLKSLRCLFFIKWNKRLYETP